MISSRERSGRPLADLERDLPRREECILISRSSELVVVCSSMTSCALQADVAELTVGDLAPDRAVVGEAELNAVLICLAEVAELRDFVGGDPR